MAVKKFLYFLITILFFGLIDLSSGIKIEVPSINSRNETEYIAYKGDDVIFRCHHDRPIQWIYPKNDKPIYPNIINEENEYGYTLSIKVLDVDYPAVGYYTCVEENNPFVNKSIYLYVEGASKLFVETLKPQVGYQSQPLLIPCRPTSPDIHVELMHSDMLTNSQYRIKPGEQSSGDDTLWNYDRRIGLTWLNPKPTIQKVVYCEFSINGTKKVESCTIYKIYKFYNTMNQPVIKNGTSEDFFGEGRPLKLRCELSYEEDRETPNLKWLKDGEPLINMTNGITFPKYSEHTSNTDTSLSLTFDKLIKSQHEGVYTCVASDKGTNSSESINIKILKKGTHFVHIEEENGIYNITTNSGEEAIWGVKVLAFPRAKVEWFKNNKIAENPDIIVHGFTHILRINSTSIDDMGDYTIKASNQYVSNSSTLHLQVKSKPRVKLHVQPFNIVNTPTPVSCQVTGFPQPDILLYYRSCQNCEFKQIKAERNMTTKSSVNVTVNIQSDQSGSVKCIANNSYGMSEDVKNFIISDVENGFQIWLEENGEEVHIDQRQPVKMAIDDDVKFYCAAANQKYTEEMDWLYNGTEKDDITSSITKYSKKIYFSIEKLKASNAGRYSCKVRLINRSYDEKSFMLLVTAPEKPRIISTNLNHPMDNLILPNEHRMNCSFDGIPRPKIIWYKDGEEFNPDGSRVIFKNNKQEIVFTKTILQDEGTYQCLVINKMGEEKVTGYMGFSNGGKLHPYIYAIIAILLVVTLVILLCLCLRIRKENELKRALRRAGLENFVEGQVDSINPDIGIDDQAELLPYHKAHWEIPRANIKLGKQLGSGAFGIVMKAEVIGLNDEKEPTTVAVKTVKKNVDYIYLKALSSELKIMGHLGSHVNVVNLIGACTTNIAKGELFVVVEFCRFGNLHNYLLRHRANFINQVDPDTNMIDYNIGVDLLERSFSVSSSQSQEPSSPRAMQDYRENYNNTGRTQYTATTTVCMTPTGQDEPLTSNNSVQPEWRTNYAGDYKGKIKPICTKDLLTWAFQVARGMEYLASRRVLHGDLAARNILLSDNNIIKICDFGLAKQMYKDNNYKKQNNSPLPIKWMAIESITDRVFSTQSDVWSYGIVMWEIFSLAKTPYPGMEADEILYRKLVNGYRMECPPYATPEIYDIMSDCWNVKPMNRPTFTKLTERIGSLLEQAVLRYYIDLNDPYLQMNTKRFQDVQSDYLKMASPPDFQNLSTPQYVNYDSGISSPVPGQPYMLMKPAHIFSPRVLKDGEVFTFDDIKKEKPERDCLEMSPMLNLKDRDNLSKPNSPEPGEMPSYSNPSYNKMPLVKGDIKTKDNYVNMPQNKNKNEFTNVDDKSKNGDHHYVNSVSRDWEREVIMA